MDTQSNPPGDKFYDPYLGRDRTLPEGPPPPPAPDAKGACGDKWYPDGWDPEKMDWKEPEEMSQRQTMIDPAKTWVPSRLLWGLVLLTAAGVWASAGIFFQINTRLARIEERQSLNWTLDMQTDYAWQVEKQNPNWHAPDIQRIFDTYRRRGEARP